MHRPAIFGLLLLAIGLGSVSASAAEVWNIVPERSCTGLTAGWTKPLADLNKLLGPRWRPAPGATGGTGTVLVFVTHCPASTIADRKTGPFTAAFVLVPVYPLLLDASAPVPPNTQWIAVLAAAGGRASPVMKLFQRHGVPITVAHVSLKLHAGGKSPRAEAEIRTMEGTLRLTADMQPASQPFKSALTTAVGVRPPAILFSGPEASTRYGKGTGKSQTAGHTWLSRYGLRGAPAFVAVDTDFRWQFEFTPSAEP